MYWIQLHIKKNLMLKILIGWRFFSTLNIDENDIQALFDVITFYPSIPTEKALECVWEKLKNDDNLADRTDWNVDDIIKILSIFLETHFKTIDGQIFTQIDGTPIGKWISGPLADGTPIGKSFSGLLADLYIIWFEEENIFSENNKFRPFIKSWKRFRDIHIIWSGGSDTLDCFCCSSKLN